MRLERKITKKSFRTSLFTHEADRAIQTKKPKHLYAGKMSNGTRNKR